MRYLGIDYGGANVGIALSDEEGKTAFPHKVIPNRGNYRLAIEVLRMADANDAHTIVIGKSLNDKGEPNPIMKDIEDFYEKLGWEIRERGHGSTQEAKGKHDHAMHVIYEDEGGTTQEAKHLQGDAKNLDASAAALILQSHLERLTR